MTRHKHINSSEPAFTVYHSSVGRPKTSMRLTSRAISERYRELLELRARLQEAQGQLNEKSAETLCPRAF